MNDGKMIDHWYDPFDAISLQIKYQPRSVTHRPGSEAADRITALNIQSNII